MWVRGASSSQGFVWKAFVIPGGLLHPSSIEVIVFIWQNKWNQSKNHHSGIQHSHQVEIKQLLTDNFLYTWSEPDTWLTFIPCGPGMNEWFSRVPGILTVLCRALQFLPLETHMNFIPEMCCWHRRYKWSGGSINPLVVSSRLALATSLFTVQPTPSQRLFPMRSSKAMPLCNDAKFFIMERQIGKVLKFLYCAAAASLK